MVTSPLIETDPDVVTFGVRIHLDRFDRADLAGQDAAHLFAGAKMTDLFLLSCSFHGGVFIRALSVNNRAEPYPVVWSTSPLTP